MSDPLEHPCRRCGAASRQPCTDRAGHIKRDVHAAHRRTAQPAATASAIEWLRHVDDGSLWCVEDLAAGLYVTYAILDPRTDEFVYVGQSGSFARRIADHLKTRTERPHSRLRPIRAWIWDVTKTGSTPRFRVLDICETEERSLASEALWVERLAAQGHKLLNRWLNHHQDRSPLPDERRKRPCRQSQERASGEEADRPVPSPRRAPGPGAAE